MRTSLIIFAILFLALPCHSVWAENSKEAFRSTDLPLPRFVALRSGEVYARTGPSKTYPIRYVYQRKNMPVEVVLEYEGWRKIRDINGDEGWVHNSLLTGKRYGIMRVEGEGGSLPLYKSPKEGARILARIEPGSVVALEKCEKGDWCYIDAAGYKGWVPRKAIWGLYPQEFFN